MSGEQLLKEYHSDLPEIQEKTLRFDSSEYVDKYLRKHLKQNEVIITKIFRMSSGNRYVGICIYRQEGVGKGRGWRWSAFHIGLMNTEKGVASIAFYSDSGQSVVFTPHFFKRYKERFSNVCDWKVRNRFSLAKSIEDIISIYISRNKSVVWIETDTEFYNRTHIFAPVEDGVALLQWDGKRKVLQANTFVTMDMLNKKQTGMVNIAIAYISLPEEERMKYKFPDFMQSQGDKKQRNQN